MNIFRIFSARLADAEKEIKRLEGVEREIEKLREHTFRIEELRARYMMEMQDRYIETGENKYSLVADSIGVELGHFQLLKRELKHIIDMVLSR